MAISKVSVYTRTTDANGKRQCDLADPKKSYPAGTIFCLRYEANGRRKLETLKSTGVTFKYALAIARLRESELLMGAISKTKNAPVVPVVAEPVKPARVTIEDAVAKYLDDVRGSKSVKTFQGYSADIAKFRASCKKVYVDEITEDDLQEFVRYLRRQDYSKRTIYNIFQSVNTFLRVNKIMLGSQILRKLSGEYDEKIVEAYTDAELKALFAACDAEERLVFKFFLTSGCREGEVIHTEWRDLDFTNNILHIQPKPEWNWKVKDREDRHVPLSESLMAELKARRNGGKAYDLVFPNKQGKPEGHFLRKLKAVATLAGIEGKIELHKFRKTFATMRADGGDSVRTIQNYLGHSSLEVTQAYLKGQDAKSAQAQAKTNQVFAAFA
jgi:integrase/recombinase XerD